MTQESDWGSVYVRILDAGAFFAQDVVGLLLGDKPVAYNDATREQLAFLSAWAQQLGLAVVNLGKIRNQDQPDGTPRYGVLIAKDRGALARAAARWRGPYLTGPAIGRLLGYPDCCAAAFGRFQKRQEKDPGADMIDAIAAASGPGPYPFLLNNVLVFNSKRCAAGREDREKLADLNRDQSFALKLPALISWHPCSYQCRPSLRAARRIWAYVQRYSPDAAARLRRRLSAPVLFLSWSKFAAFRGRVARGRLKYSQVVAPHSLLDAEILELIRAGDELRIEAPGVWVSRGGKKRWVLKEDRARLLGFTSRLSV